jgi:hypothetical protein
MSGSHRLEVLPGKVLQPEYERTTCNGFLHDLRMQRELVANGRANQVRAVRIKAFFNQKIDLSEVDRPEIDGDLFRLAALGARALRRCRIFHFPIP